MCGVPLSIREPTMDNERIVLCDACGSEGRDLRSNGGPDDIDYGECSVCEGQGSVIIETAPIDKNDLDAIIDHHGEIMCFHCSGSGDDQNRLNDPGPCPYCNGYGYQLRG